MAVYIPKWLARVVFRETEADLSRRAKVTGAASRNFRYEFGPIAIEWTATVDEASSSGPDAHVEAKDKKPI
jgi:hypothetical protein